MVNKVILLGNLGNDPEIRHSNKGSKIATFSLATNESWKDRTTGERKTITQWHRVVIFNENTAGFVEQYAKKGSKVYLEGSLQNRKYTGSDGIEKFISEVVVSQFSGDIRLLDGRNKDDQVGSEAPAYSTSNTNNSPKEHNIGDDLDDEIPF